MLDRIAAWSRRLLVVQRDQWLPRGQLEALQWARFKRLLEHAYERSPYSRERLLEAGITPSDVRDREDLARIPITRREDLRDSAGLLAAGFRAERLKRSLTSGSTGRPTTTYFDRESWMTGKHLLKLRARLACGLRPWDRIALLHESPVRDSLLSRTVLRRRSFSIMVPPAEILPALRAYRPTAIYGFPSHLLTLARERDAIRPRLVFTSGEMLDDATRGEMARSFGAEVFDVYGCTEAKEIAWECPEREDRTFERRSGHSLFGIEVVGLSDRTARCSPD